MLRLPVFMGFSGMFIGSLIGLGMGLVLIKFYAIPVGEAYRGTDPDAFQRLGSVLVALAVVLFALVRPISDLVRNALRALGDRIGLGWRAISMILLIVASFFEVAAIVLGTLQWGYGDLWLCAQPRVECIR